MSIKNLIDLPSGKYSQAVVLVDSLGIELTPSLSPEFEIARTGLYKGKVANLGYCIARRSDH
jgi:hypothetical protein